MITIDQLREISMRYLDSQSITLIYMLKFLDEILLVDNEVLVYPKHLYCRDEDLILYVFTNHQLLTITYDSEVVHVVTQSLRYLMKFEYQLAENYHQLIMTFDNDAVISLHPKQDTILPYVKEFNGQLVLICRYLQEKF